MLTVDLSETTTIFKKKKKGGWQTLALKFIFYIVQIIYLQNKFLLIFAIVHISVGNFIDVGKSPFSKKVINIDQQRT